jgi:hypothetical protein
MTHYDGHQWQVTEYGIERKDGNYFIRAEDLRNDLGPGGWVGHMSEKDWVDIEDFKRAYQVALRVHSQRTGQA